MMKHLRSILLPSLVLVMLGSAAQGDRFAYAITDASGEGASWNALRKLDLHTGKYSAILLNGTESATTVYNADGKKELAMTKDAQWGTMLHAPFSTGVAAAAYDRKHNRLYFTPMFIDQLRYVDLKTMKVYYVAGEAFTGLGNLHNDEAKCVTRMVIAPDGNGYAITNDGNTVIQFTTGKKTKITRIGALVDDAANGNISIHNRCSSFGGDMIADDGGNLYILSARNHAFKINIDTRVATHLGAIKGLPADFTVNGAVVNGDGNLLVGSAVNAASYYVVNPQTWEASAYATASVFRSSDLANSNFLASVSPGKATIEGIAARPSVLSKYIQVYPNPVTTNNFNLQFRQVPVGEYTVEVTDVMGRKITQRRVVVSHKNNTQQVSLASTDAKGIYLVRVADRARKTVFEQKVIIQ
ncbi:MAG: T9SS type A sorting domain-containing protein [Chitinophagaceae bacterium]